MLVIFRLISVKIQNHISPMFITHKFHTIIDKLQGFIVRQPYSGQIINGIKKQELRNFKTTKLNQPVYLLSEGLVLGKIMFTGIKENNQEWKYAWNVKVLKKFARPWRYSHPLGAQRWVKEVKPKR